ncbi:hypothetical protein pipiens_001992 [Culex pipiens pipiens]|uniref:Bystin n=1 Tax=Culex pipiens pipiens TaxID=38569 RepID=A0ABD1DMS9_CULPP
MGKSKAHRIKGLSAPKQSLGDQITEGRVSKKQKSTKFRLRAEEEEFICEMEYSGANSIFIRIILDKRYALPYRVVDAAVFHFLRFEQDKRELPTLWHNALLTFAQRYKNDISSEQRDALLQLLKKKSHAKITPEIRRELVAARCRDVEGGDSLVHETDMEYKEDTDYAPMEDAASGPSSGKVAAKGEDEEMEDDDDEEDDDDADSDEEEL